MGLAQARPNKSMTKQDPPITKPVSVHSARSEDLCERRMTAVTAAQRLTRIKRVQYDILLFTREPYNSVISIKTATGRVCVR